MTGDKLIGGVALRSLLAASLFPLFGVTVQAQQITGVPGSPGATTTTRWRATSAAAAEIRWQDRAQRRAIEALVAAARGAAQGRAEHSAHHDRRCRLRRT